MNLLYVVAKAEYFLSHRLDLANCAKDAGFNVAVATTSFSKTDTLRLNGLTAFVVRFVRGSLNPFTEFKTVFDLVNIFRNFRPGLVHNVALKPALYGAAIARFYGLPSVNAINGFGYVFTSNQLKARLLRPLVKLALRLVLNHKSVRVIVQNRDDYNECAALLPRCELSLIAGSGVDIQAFSFKHYSGIFTFTLAARMLWSKGVGEFVDAAKMFRLNNPGKEVRFLLVGSPDSENPESIPVAVLKEWQLEKVIEWRGYSDNIQEIYAQTSVAVLPSYREGMPKSLLEAMACGLPVITTNVRGCYDLVENGVSGIMVPVRSVSALCAAMQECYADHDRCSRMGAAARKNVELLYSSGIINRKFIVIYNKISHNF